MGATHGSVAPLGFGVTPVFDWNMKSSKRFTINQGGSSSSKTYSILQCLLILGRSMSPAMENKTITVTAESLPALKVGAIRDFESIISKPPFSHYIQKVNRGTPWFVRLWNGATIEFRAFPHAEAAKHGKRAILFINEASNVPYEIAKALMLRSSKVFIDFNPSADFWAHERYLGHPNAQWIYSTFRDNPFADRDMVADIEALKSEDPEMWKVYGLGRRGNLRGQVFPNVIWVEDLPEYLSDVTYGMDIGFTNSYTTLCKVGMADGKMWGQELLYERGLIEPDIVERLEALNISHTAEIIVDNANAMVIEYLRREGDFNAIACAKKDVQSELQAMKRYQWRITADSINWKKEAKNYLYRKQKDGSLENTPIKAYDHLWDAARYAFLRIVNPGSLPEFL